ncbi:unnamed protein product [Leuciscus chuanchicus]
MEAGKERESERVREGRGDRGNCGSRDGELFNHKRDRFRQIKMGTKSSDTPGGSILGTGLEWCLTVRHGRRLLYLSLISDEPGQKGREEQRRKLAEGEKMPEKGSKEHLWPR